MKSQSIKISIRTIACVTACLALTYASKAQYITQTGGDGYGASAITGVNWSDGLAPHSGANYINNSLGDPTGATGTSYLIRTPNGGTTPVTFGGDSLTLANWGSTGISFKGGVGQSLSINLIMGNSIVVTAPGTAINGSIAVNGTSGTYSEFAEPGTGSTFAINSSISGGGILNFIGTGTINLTSANNTFSGGTRIGNASGLTVTADGALGTGNVTFNGASTLTLQGGTLNDYIANTANLTLSSVDTVNLNYSGIDYVAGVSLDGGTSLNTTPGTTFGATGSGATVTSSAFIGTGLLEIQSVPEPSSLALVSIGGGGLLLLLRRRR